MARERKKPEGSFIERTKNEIENEDTLLTNRAYELGRIRGRKETIDKACDWIKRQYPIHYTEYNELAEQVIAEFCKAMEK